MLGHVASFLLQSNNWLLGNTFINGLQPQVSGGVLRSKWKICLKQGLKVSLRLSGREREEEKDERENEGNRKEGGMGRDEGKGREIENMNTHSSPVMRRLAGLTAYLGLCLF